MSFIVPCATYFDTHGSQAAKDVSASRDKLIDLFDSIEHYFRRLEIYTGFSPTMAMTEIVIDIMAEVLTILAIATKEAKRGRLSGLHVDLPFSTDTLFRKDDRRYSHRG